MFNLYFQEKLLMNMTKTKTSSELNNKVLTEACKGNETTFKGIKELVSHLLLVENIMLIIKQ